MTPVEFLEKPYAYAGNRPRPRGQFVAADDEDFVILACSVLIQSQSVTDGQTDRQTYRRLGDS